MTEIDTSTEAIAKLMDGVTPAPWRVGPVDDTRVEAADGSEVALIDGDYNEPDLWPIMEANARFIAAARELVPALTAERDAMRAELEAARAEEASWRMASQEAEHEVAAVRAQRDAAEAKLAKAVEVLREISETPARRFQRKAATQALEQLKGQSDE